MRRRGGHHGFAAPERDSTHKFQTLTAAQVQRQQAERERALKGTELMRQALARPGSIFRLKADVRAQGPLTALQALVLDASGAGPLTPCGFRRGAFLLYLGRTRANDTQGINRPVHMFLAMGLAGRFAVHDFELLEPVTVRA